MPRLKTANMYVGLKIVSKLEETNLCEVDGFHIISWVYDIYGLLTNLFTLRIKAL